MQLPEKKRDCIFFTVFCILDVANRNSLRIIYELRAEICTPKQQNRDTR